MSYDELPARTEPEDLLHLCQVLREGGKTEEELDDMDDLDIGRHTIPYGTNLGFIQQNAEGELTNTDNGTQLGYRDDFSEATEPLFLEGIERYEFYRELTIHLFDGSDGGADITQKEILPELRTAFEIRDLSDDMLKRTTRCYLKTIDKAGFGEYVTGRRGKPTRIELNDDISGLLTTVAQEEAPEQEETTQEPDSEPDAESAAANGDVAEPHPPPGNESVDQISQPQANVEVSENIGGTEVIIEIEISSQDWEADEVIKFLNKFQESSD